jgi:hypothetical protein
MEILVVVAIIVAMASLGTLAVLSYLNKARADLARARTNEVTAACKVYWIDHKGQWPQGLQALLVADQVGGPWLEKQDAIIDPYTGGVMGYDPNGSRNTAAGNNGRPDVWCQPPGGEPIGNW